MVDMNTMERRDLDLVLVAEVRREVVPLVAARIMGLGSEAVVERGLARWVMAWTPGDVVSYCM